MPHHRNESIHERKRAMPNDCLPRRRDFLANACKLGGALTASAVARAMFPAARALAADMPWTMRLSTSSVQFSSLPIEDACKQIAALGFEAIDLWHEGFGCPHLNEIEKRIGVDGLKDLLARHRLKLGAVTCYLVGYRRYAELLGKAGGGLAIWGSRPGKPTELVAETKTFLEQLKPELELAEKHNSYLAIENHEGDLLDSHDSFRAFVDLNRSTRLGIALAPYHLQRAGIGVEDVIATVGKQLFFFYAWQNGEGVQQLPGIGPTDCKPWLAALAKAGYRGCVNPFMHGHMEADKMAAALAIATRYLKKRSENIGSA
jgi:sugar phosphate isomerase/epimerase